MAGDRTRIDCLEGKKVMKYIIKYFTSLFRPWLSLAVHKLEQILINMHFVYL